MKRKKITGTLGFGVIGFWRHGMTLRDSVRVYMHKLYTHKNKQK